MSHDTQDVVVDGKTYNNARTRRGKTAFKDLTGQRFGRLIVLRENGRTKQRHIIWECRCDCGTIKSVDVAALRTGGTRSCGCFGDERRVESHLKDLTGKVFGRLTAISRIRKVGKVYFWLCRCSCGKEMETTTTYLMTGHTRSCGCLKRDTTIERLTTHGMSGTPEHLIWLGMIRRCHDEKFPGYDKYGGQGIVVAECWRTSFEQFYKDVGPRPSPLHSLDRFPNKGGNYEPGNVRWADFKQQGRNRKDNRLLEHNGETLPLSQWAERSGISRSTIVMRLERGWSVEQAITSPLRHAGKQRAAPADKLQALVTKFRRMREHLAADLGNDADALAMMQEAFRQSLPVS